MEGMTWLHLSDWHQGSEAFVKYQKSEAFDRELLAKRLKQDILNRTKISNDLAKIDFIVFSGDVAFSGQAAEYQAAVEQLFTPVLEATGLGKKKIFIIPGNHDLDRRKFEYLPTALTNPFSFDAEVNQWLAKKSDRKYVLIPFEAYEQFINSFNGQNHPTFASVEYLDIDGKKVALLGLNSAFMCGRNKSLKNGKEEVDDYGKLVVGEPQLDDGLDRIEEADVCIAVLHHPFEWLMHNERSRTEEQLGEKFHFILCGHEHFPKVNKIEGTSGDCFVIPAGAGFDRRIPEDPSYTNAYNFVHLNFDNGQFTIYLRRWNNRNRVWDKDTSKYLNGQVSFILPKLLGNPVPDEETPASPLPNTPAATIPGSNKEETPASPLPGTPAVTITIPGSFTDNANKVVVIILTYQERSDLTNALLKVYPNEGDFEIMFERNFEKKLNTLVDGDSYWKRVYRLLEWTEAEGRTYDLIRSAHDERPRNPALQSWLQRYEADGVRPEAPGRQVPKKEVQDELTNSNKRAVDLSEKAKPGEQEQNIKSTPLITIEQARKDVKEAQSNVQKAGALFIAGKFASSVQFREARSLLSKARQSTDHLKSILNTDVSLPEPLKTNQFRIFAQINIIYDQIDKLHSDLKNGIQGDYRPLNNALSNIQGLISD